MATEQQPCRRCQQQMKTPYSSLLASRVRQHMQLCRCSRAKEASAYRQHPCFHHLQTARSSVSLRGLSLLLLAQGNPQIPAQLQPMQLRAKLWRNREWALTVAKHQVGIVLCNALSWCSCSRSSVQFIHCMHRSPSSLQQWHCKKASRFQTQHFGTEDVQTMDVQLTALPVSS